MGRAEENKGRHIDYDEIPYAALEVDVPRVLRFVGDPLEVRSKGTDPKEIFSSKILDDKGSLATFRWSKNKNWILWKIYNKVMEYTWDKEAPNPNGRSKKGAKVYKNDILHPELFKRVRWNDKENNPFEGGWYPTKSILMNCIDREDYAWHKANKSYKIVAKKKSSKKDDSSILFHEPGIPGACYTELLNTVVEERGDWQDFDVAIKKLEAKPWYKVYSASDSRKIENYLQQNNLVMSSSSLSEEELSWKLWDFDNHPAFQVSSYNKIMNKLGDFIKRVDVAFNTHFYEELVVLAEQEKKEWAEKRESEKENSSEELEQETVAEEPVAEKATEKPARKIREPAQKAASDTEDRFAKAKQAGWKGLDSMPENEKSLIKSISLGSTPEDDVVVYVDDAGIELAEDDATIAPCYECGLPVPESINNCLRCGSLF